MRIAEWFAYGPGVHRATWWRTLWDTAGVRFWCSIAASMLVAVGGVLFDSSIVIVVGVMAALLFGVAWLAVTTSEYRRHQHPLR